MSELNRASEEQLINRCVAEIEEKLQWGSAAGWSNFDFEKLTTEIQDKTGIYLSITTLKRVFGKIKYPHDPSSTTLNTLAAFLGHSD